ncbi:MAG: c-type cytochrome biogenesis protein CcsB [Gammaproteobacteria bacterium]|nr:c-type cytochrome biogenesis protein CcsB [Gammaproteobacteria bacterium]
MAVTQQELHEQLQRRSFLRTLGPLDWIYAILIVTGAAFAHYKYAYLMDIYEVVIMLGVAAAVIALGWYWKSIRILLAVVAAVSLTSVMLYGPQVAALKAQGMDGRSAIAALSSLTDPAHSKFLFKYFLSSTSAIMWMSALFFLATITYLAHLFTRNLFVGKVASAMTWSAVAMGLIGMMVRWRESYLIGLDIGHIPVSNLYEVFILFSIITALIYLHYEAKYKTRTMGGFVLLVISAAIGFLLWYQFDRGANTIEPLVPALKSYWMKIHVPANFIGYGSFSLAAMLGLFYLLIDHAKDPKRSSQIIAMVIVFVVGTPLALYKFGIGSAQDVSLVFGSVFASMALLWVLGFGSVRAIRSIGYDNLPKVEVLDDIMHKAIGLGFGFFTLATVLGALWAAEAWGGFWSWDPKETWALIVWLNYAAWLHMRLTKGWRGTPLAWWAVVGLFVTTFAFLGVNMFLSGLHSYGRL